MPVFLSVSIACIYRAKGCSSYKLSSYEMKSFQKIRNIYTIKNTEIQSDPFAFLKLKK